MINIINQIFEIDKKAKANQYSKIERNIKRLNNELESLGYVVENPEGRSYSVTDSDLEVSMSDQLSKNPKVTKVLKPVIYEINDGERVLVQKGVVVVA